MDFYAINNLRENHAGWSLLRAQNAPLALTFFVAAFTGPNQRNLGRQELIDVLDDVLFGLRDSEGEDRFPRPTGEYLDDWAADDRKWLRKYYVPGEDEPHYDLTAAAEDVVRWVENLRGRDFVATQSRLTSIFAVLKQLVQQSETDPEVRLAELQRQRDGIDAEMQRIHEGSIRVMTGPEALDHLQQLTALAKDLLSDFRGVEQNFRRLDRQVREQIATWDGTQGELLESILDNQQDISSSLQGRTFQGFWDYLMLLPPAGRIRRPAAPHHSCRRGAPGHHRGVRHRRRTGDRRVRLRRGRNRRRSRPRARGRGDGTGQHLRGHRQTAGQGRCGQRLRGRHHGDCHPGRLHRPA
jgi:cell division protein ZapA (FtsZ GTPase activity inhibitor)